MSHGSLPVSGQHEAPAKRASTLALGSWTLYEWASQPFYTLITTFLFSAYFVSGFVGDPTRGQALWGYLVAAAGICVALVSPVLGAIADASGRKKPWVAFASMFFVAGMAVLWFALPGRLDLLWIIALGYIVATVAVELNAVFVNALMPKLVPPSQYGRLSGISSAVGYAGGLLSLIVLAGLLVANPVTGKTLLGLEPLLPLDAASRQGDRMVGLFAAAWFLVFVIPFFLFVPDPPSARRSAAPVREGIAAFKQSLVDIKEHGNIVRFLVSRMLYQDGLLGIYAFATVYATSLFGWQQLDQGVFGIVLSAAAILGALVGGFIDDRIGPKAVIIGSILLALVATLGVLSIGREHVLFTMPVAAKVAGSGLFGSVSEQVFLAFSVVMGLVAGPLFASSRSLMAAVSPPDKLAQFFGLFALSGKATSFMAPLLIGLVTQVTSDQRLGVGVVVAFLVLGLVLMLRVQRTRAG
jgi:MFS transporter, UMF1 family